MLVKNLNFFICSSIVIAAKVFAAQYQPDIRVLGNSGNNVISYGLEVEYNIADLDKNKGASELFNYYYRSDMTPTEWVALSMDEKNRVAHEDLDVGRPGAPVQMLKLAPEFVNGVDVDAEGHFVGEKAFLYTYLIDHLDRESGGAYEVNGQVFTDFNLLSSYVQELDKNFGEGNWEGHVVNDFAPLKGLAGYSLFFHDMHLLRREGHDYEMFKKTGDPLYRPGELYRSYSLRPVERPTMVGAYKLEKIATTDYKKAGWTLEDYCTYYRSARVRRSSGVCYRLSNYPLKKIGVEIRTHELGYRTQRPDPDASMNMVESMDITSKFLQYDGDFRKFQFMDKSYGPTEVFITDPRSLVVPDNEEMLTSEYIQQYLKRMLISDQLSWRNKRRVKKYLKKVRDLPFDCKRFLYPLRDWFDHPILRTIDKRYHSKIRNRIVEKTIDFLKEILQTTYKFPYSDRDNRYNLHVYPTPENLDKDDPAKKYHKKAYSLACQDAVGVPAGKWAYEVNIKKYFVDYIQKSIRGFESGQTRDQVN